VHATPQKRRHQLLAARCRQLSRRCLRRRLAGARTLDCRLEQQEGLRHGEYAARVACVELRSTRLREHTKRTQSCANTQTPMLLCSPVQRPPPSSLSPDRSLHGTQSRTNHTATHTHTRARTLQHDTRHAHAPPMYASNTSSSSLSCTAATPTLGAAIDVLVDVVDADVVCALADAGAMCSCARTSAARRRSRPSTSRKRAIERHCVSVITHTRAHAHAQHARTHVSDRARESKRTSHSASDENKQPQHHINARTHRRRRWCRARSSTCCHMRTQDHTRAQTARHAPPLRLATSLRTSQTMRHKQTVTNYITTTQRLNYSSISSALVASTNRRTLRVRTAITTHTCTLRVHTHTSALTLHARTVCPARHRPPATKPCC
jgi:hypothetical protein